MTKIPNKKKVVWKPMSKARAMKLINNWMVYLENGALKSVTIDGKKKEIRFEWRNRVTMEMPIALEQLPQGKVK